MGGGLMQLVAYGAQDVYLTGNPQITFFKVVYRRHTNFSMQSIEQTLTGNPDFGRKTSVTIVRNGDLCTKMYLLVTLNSVRWSNPENKAKFAWIRRLGHALIESVEIEIGGSRIDKQYGTWLDLWYELTHDVNQEAGYRAMIGDVDALTRLDGPDANMNVKDQYTMYIPLQFWFNRNSGLALPLIALQYHEVRVLFEFADVNKLINWRASVENGQKYVPEFKALSIKEASVLVDYVYLDAHERRRFAQVGHEYLIEQVQFTGNETLTGNSNTSNLNYKSKLGFNHPTKELIWVVKNSTFAGDERSSGGAGAGHPFLAYTNDDAKWDTDALQYAADNIAAGMFRVVPVADAIPVVPADADNAAVELSARELDQPASVLTLTTSSNHKVRVNVFVAGTANAAGFRLEMNKYPIYSGAVSATGATGFNFADYIDNVTLNVTLTPTAGSVVAVVATHHLSLNDVSIPLDWNVAPNNLNDNRLNTFQGVNPFDVYVIQFNNYGLRLDGKGNPVAEAGLQLNGQDRFDPRLGSYFNYVQPWQHHTRTPADGVNVYSFALQPEQHQPTGSCNLSRIDNTTVMIKLVDQVRTAFNTKPKLAIDLSNAKLYTYALSYNVLRIMSGMGGLAYSN